MNNPDNFINDHFQSIKNLIANERDELISKIQICYGRLIDEVDQTEKVCKISKPLEVLKLNDNIIKLEKEIEVFDKNLQKLSNEVDNMKVNEENWDKITFESGYQKIKLKKIFKNYTNNLLTNKSFTFLSKMEMVLMALWEPSFHIEEFKDSMII